MDKRSPEVFAKLASLPTAGLGEAPEGFETVREFLQRFGYLDQISNAKAAPALPDWTTPSPPLSPSIRLCTDSIQAAYSTNLQNR